MRKIIKVLSSPMLMAALLIMLIVAMAMATFIENDFGSEAARLRVYNSRWFEFLLVLFALNLLIRIFELRLYRIKKFPVFLFHLAFVVMIIGAGITRYFGYQGTMHIREGGSSSFINTNQDALVLRIFKNGANPKNVKIKADIKNKKRFRTNVGYQGENLEFKLTRFFRNAYKQPVESASGNEVVGIAFMDNTFRGFQYLVSGEGKTLGNNTISFNGDSLSDFCLISDSGSLYIVSVNPMLVKPMEENVAPYVVTGRVPFENRTVYEIAGGNIVFQEYYQSAVIDIAELMPGERVNGMKVLEFEVSNGEVQSEFILWEDMWGYYPVIKNLGDLTIEMAYGPYTIDLPFSLYLDDFSIERYPGSNSPSSFSSFVRVMEEGKEPMPYHIFMNNILKYKGFRFFQSSYDTDEQGTILSVNHDRWGAGITYFSYILLALGILLSLISRNTFFRKVKTLEKTLILIVLLFIANGVKAEPEGQVSPETFKPVTEKHATRFGELLVQNAKGRTEPVYTYSSELVRKIARKEKIERLTPAQVFLEMNLDPAYWSVKPIIRISNRELQQQLGLQGKYASYSDFFSQNNGYILQDMVRQVYSKPVAMRSKFDKAVLKTDEKVNICYEIFSGRFLRILPVPGIADSSKWHTPDEASLMAVTPEDSVFLAGIVQNYFSEIVKAKQNGDYTMANKMLEELALFQRKNAGYKLPGTTKVKTEIAYVKANIFKKLFPFYFTLGIFYLFYLIILIVIGMQNPRWVQKGFSVIVLLAFAAHTLGVAIRWYISGHAPMSNGYESMIFISWVTILAGYLFGKKSGFTLAATVILAGLTLMVANLSFMDPEITNLVPVLQSYWLTIHVSVITASYGFLGLGALLGLINLLLVVLRTDENHSRISETFTSLTIINHRTLILGLYFLTIGTFLGAVWANESWGRYWGWDPKETWALISVLVYAFVTHARLIPGLKGDFTFNVLSVYGFGSILMTYFGVNYYLSGLHSYAGGDPVPIPSFVYISVAALIVLTLVSSVKFSKNFSGKPDII